MPRLPVRRSRSPRGPFVPRLERLEDRLVLSVAVRQVGDTLIIRGDDKPNHIIISDNGTGAAHNIQVAAGNGSTFTSGTDPVTKVLVRTGKGGDTVDYNLTGSTASVMTVDVHLGKGADNFNGHLNGHALLSGANYKFAVRGGDGHNDLDFSSGAGAAISAGAKLTVNEVGGDDADHLSLAYDGVLDGRLNFHLDGRGGPDVLSANVNIRAGSKGTLGVAGDDATLSGGRGNDTLTYLVHTNGSTADVFALANGGPGTDTAFHTKNVTAVNVEHDHIVP
jgi:hypothetical protein